ncbi:hypothetical protein JB92DRAFT_2998747, partial [Gautieria morchelliformis]
MYPGTPKYATAAAAAARASLNALDSSPGSFSPRSSHSSTPSLPDLDEVTTLRLETFGPYREPIRMAKMMLTWTRNGEKVYNCILLVSLCWFSCLVASCTSSPSPIKPPPPYHQYHRQRRGGFSGVVKQSKRDSGIKMKAQIPTASADDPFIVSPHLGTPSTASSALSIPDLPLPSHSSLPSHSTTPSPSMFTIPDLPLPSHSSQYPASKGPTVPASPLDMPPSNQLAAFHTTTNSDSGYQLPPMYNGDTGAIETTPRSKRNLSYLTDSVTIMPGDRRHGDTACLWELPDAHTAFTYNRH